VVNPQSACTVLLSQYQVVIESVREVNRMKCESVSTPAGKQLHSYKKGIWGLLEGM
jgi:hypothetical protein